MLCPRCEQATLDEREREGITVDVCRSCRGMWLDRGELEKLIARATRELEDAGYGRGEPAYPPGPPPYASSAPPPPHFRRDDTPPRGTPRHGEHGGHHQHGHHYDPRKRKKHWLESLGDVFD